MKEGRRRREEGRRRREEDEGGPVCRRRLPDGWTRPPDGRLDHSHGEQRARGWKREGGRREERNRGLPGSEWSAAPGCGRGWRVAGVRVQPLAAANPSEGLLCASGSSVSLSFVPARGEE
jgi:hypothetical protein